MHTRHSTGSFSNFFAVSLLYLWFLGRVHIFSNSTQLENILPVCFKMKIDVLGAILGTRTHWHGI